MTTENPNQEAAPKRRSTYITNEQALLNPNHAVEIF